MDCSQISGQWKLGGLIPCGRHRPYQHTQSADRKIREAIGNDGMGGSERVVHDICHKQWSLFCACQGCRACRTE